MSQLGWVMETPNLPSMHKSVRIFTAEIGHYAEYEDAELAQCYAILCHHLATRGVCVGGEGYSFSTIPLKRITSCSMVKNSSNKEN